MCAESACQVPKRENASRSTSRLNSTIRDSVKNDGDGAQLQAMSECANPLLLGWIKEWLDQARERNSKGFTV